MLAHGRHNNDDTLLILIGIELLDFINEFLPLIITWDWLRHLNIVPGLPGSLIVQGKEIVVESEKGIFLAHNMGNILVVGGWAKIFQLLLGENVFSSDMNLRVSMLSGLGSGHIDDLARTIVDEDVTSLSQGRALNRIGQRCTSISRVDGIIMIISVRHFGKKCRVKLIDVRSWDAIVVTVEYGPKRTTDE